MDSEDKSTTQLYKGGYSQQGRGHARESSCNVIRCYFISISTSTGTAINFIHWNFQPLPRLLCPTQPAQPVLAANTNAFAWSLHTFHSSHPHLQQALYNRLLYSDDAAVSAKMTLPEKPSRYTEVGVCCIFQIVPTCLVYSRDSHFAEGKECF